MTKDLPEITSKKVKIVLDSGCFYCPYIPDIPDISDVLLMLPICFLLNFILEPKNKND